ncbi:hypothetical protein TNIN_317931 [Trichonephila inaurata madagascariensis]|uniref:Integrase zinc-binding domain-containing protein n=1 Tax=Trichonephila inaurata madagascariensis TaxID=2747483 RepID=A0A8X6IEJ6_9ARAC|nr:hypothetical protein TNIN_317931 [Trichonephila inaurata madagascariensis]
MSLIESRIDPLPISWEGTEDTLANIRTKFWIVNGRFKVKRVIKQCIKCLKVIAQGSWIRDRHVVSSSPSGTEDLSCRKHDFL